MTEQSTMTPEIARQTKHLKDTRERRAKEFAGRLVTAEELQAGDRFVGAYGPASTAQVIDSIKVSRSHLARHRDQFTLYTVDGYKPHRISRSSWIILIGR